MARKKIVYTDGYDHYSHNRNISIIFMVNEAEKAAMDDIMGVMGVTNMSEFIRNQVFKAYRDLTDEQKKKMVEVAEWRAEDAKLT